MNLVNNIAFFWVGQDVTIPSLLVQSIRTVMGQQCRVHQLSDRDTPMVEGVTTHKKLKLSPHIMVARLEAYAALSFSEPTLFVDADMLVMRPILLPTLAENEVGVTLRGARDTIRFSKREWAEFPEFTEKDSAQMMPYIYSFVYVRSPILFLRQLNALKKLPKRFHRWYGDQMTLKSELDVSGKFVVRNFDVNIYNRTVRSRLEFEEVCALPEAVCLAHFKGPESKREMHESLMMIVSGRLNTA